MGKKKDKKDKKQKGIEKTAVKTEKKLEKKTKKMLQEKGEDDIETLIASFQEQDRKRLEVTEEKCAPPSPRCNMTLTPHPDKDMLVMFGGEYFDGSKTYLYNDLFLFNTKTNEWSLLKAPNPPAPRCAHQAVALPQLGGQLWIFGGEFASPTQSQFYHYKDLWVFNLKDNVWQKVNTPGGPTSRSGHRMVAYQKMLFIFGGFHESTNDYKYYNDLHVFNTETYKWMKLEVVGIPPSPRSACIMAVTQDSRILVYGGYSKERVKRDVDHGQVHSDMHYLVLDNKAKQLSGDEAASDKLKLKWQQAKQSGCKPSPRSSCSLVTVAPNTAFLFGGVYDEEDDETVKGVFFNEMYTLELDKGRWHQVFLRKRLADKEPKRRRRKEKNATGEQSSEIDQSSSEDEASEAQPLDTDIHKLTVSDDLQTADVNAKPAGTSITTYDDGIFTVTIAGSSKSSQDVSGATSDGSTEVASDCFVPCARMNPLLAVKHGTLYLYGGAFEDGDRQVTLNDFYSIDLHRLDEWRTIIPLDVTVQEWYDTESSADEEEEMETEEQGATGGCSASKSVGEDDDEADDDDETSEDEAGQ